MGYITIIVLAVSIIQFVAITEAADCAKMVDFKPMECCKFPKPKPEEIEKLRAAFKAAMPDKITDFLGECKVTEKFYKDFKLAKGDDIDEEEMVKYMEKIIEDAEWKPVLKAAISSCNKKVNAKLADVQKKMEAAPYNVKKDQCNVKFTSFCVCIKAEAFEKCPSSMWTDGKNCADGKKWVTECGKNVDSMMELSTMKEL